MNHCVIYFLVLRGLKNDDNTRVSALQIILTAQPSCIERENVYFKNLTDFKQISQYLEDSGASLFLSSFG